MSIVVGIVEENQVYIGTDSQVTKGGQKSISREEENYKIWHYNKEKSIILAICGSVRERNVIKANEELFEDVDILKNNINVKNIATKTIKAIFSSLIDNSIIKEEKPYSMTSEYLLGVNNKLYSIDCDGAVLKIDDYVALGSGRYEAMGVLANNKSKNPKQRIIEAIDSAVGNDIYCGYPIVIANTTDKEFIKINKSGT